MVILPRHGRDVPTKGDRSLLVVRFFPHLTQNAASRRSESVLSRRERGFMPAVAVPCHAMRTRPSTLPLPGYDDALSLVLRHVPALGVERVSLRSARGRVLRGDLLADRDQPPFDRSAMDGFAVRREWLRVGATYRVVGSVAAGGAPLAEAVTDSGAVIRIATGAPVPAPFDAVIPIELAVVTDGADGESVTFAAGVERSWQNVHRRASDATVGATVLRAGTVMGPPHIGIAAAVGAAEVMVSQRPRITLITTGDEVVPCDAKTQAMLPQQVRNSNEPMLAAFFEAMGVPLLEHVHVPDDPEQTRAAAREALSHSHLVVTNGGVSAGQRDWLPWAWEKLGLGTVLRGVAIQPGRPVLVCSDAEEVRSSEFGVPSSGESISSQLGTRNSELGTIAAPSKLVLGLPGNPVSVLATAHLFAWPVMRLMMMQDAAKAVLPWRRVGLAERVTASSKRQVFRAAKLNSDGSASVINWHGSGDLMHTAEADAFVRLPLTDDPIEAGTMVPCLELVR